MIQFNGNSLKYAPSLRANRNYSFTHFCNTPHHPERTRYNANIVPQSGDPSLHVGMTWGAAINHLFRIPLRVVIMRGWYFMDSGRSNKPRLMHHRT